MRRMEERIGKKMLDRDGRKKRLKEDGERMMIYERRMMNIKRENIEDFEDKKIEGNVRIGKNEDYEERFLKEIMESFES